VFDTTAEKGNPVTFRVNQVIKGWTEALTRMPVGSKWEVYIPAELAYGERATGKSIKPYSALQFQIELLSVKK
jgi:FKBP-type peptidyl-prolyl cis-trans isomerase FklB